MTKTICLPHPSGRGRGRHNYFTVCISQTITRGWCFGIHRSITESSYTEVPSTFAHRILPEIFNLSLFSTVTGKAGRTIARRHLFLLKKSGSHYLGGWVGTAINLLISYSFFFLLFELS